MYKTRMSFICVSEVVMCVNILGYGLCFLCKWDIWVISHHQLLTFTLKSLYLGFIIKFLFSSESLHVSNAYYINNMKMQYMKIGALTNNISNGRWWIIWWLTYQGCLHFARLEWHFELVLCFHVLDLAN